MVLNQPRRIGKYDVLEVLGQGGMGVVYKATDPHIGRLVAIKMMTGSFAENPDLLKRFYREAQSAGNLQHPNIVIVYDLGEQDGNPYLVMEFLEGEPLDKLIASRRELSMVQKLDYIIQACNGLNYAHQRGIVHRDIKPGNLMVLRDGTVKLMDFGIAFLFEPGGDPITRTGEFMGTLTHMSPEQAMGKVIDRRSDIWAAGVVLYELLTNTLPFEGEGSIAAVLDKILHEDPPPLNAHLSHYPPELDRVLELALAKSPEERYATAAAFATDLRKVKAQLECQPELAHESGMTGPASVETSKAPSAAVTLALGRRRPETPAPNALSSDEALGVTSIFEVPPGGGAGDYGGVKQGDEPNDVSLTIIACSNPPSIGNKITLNRFPFTIGRMNADFNLSFDPAVSAKHLQIDYGAGGFCVRDLGSRNPSFVNGRRLTPLRDEPLLFGARLLLGTNTQLVFGSELLTELPDLTGTTVANRFTLLEKLHSSGKSVVYAARDSNLPQTVAIKLLSPRLCRYPGYREEFHRDAHVACELRHSNICRVIDFGETELPGVAPRAMYVCMDHMEGGSLAKRLANGEVFDSKSISAWLLPVASALDYAGVQGVVHAAIKPTAIVFDKHQRPYITDFAVATRAGKGAAHAIIGAPAFLAPEQWEGADPVPATDQYSLAVVAYLCLAGSVPHEGQEHPEVRSRNLNRGALPVHEMAAQKGRPPIQPALSKVLDRALSLRAEDRFATIGEFAQQFDAALLGSVAGEGSQSVFISYQRGPSSAWAALLKRELEREHGLRVFVDTEQRDSAGRFPRKLQRNVERCDVFVCLLAEHTLDSEWVNRELRLAHAANKPMVPVFQESFVFPGDLQKLETHVQELLSFDGVKLLDQQNIYIDAAIHKLVHCIRQSTKD